MSGSPVLETFFNIVKDVLKEEGKKNPSVSFIRAGLEDSFPDDAMEEIEQKTSEIIEALQDKTWGELIMSDEVMELVNSVLQEYHRLEKTKGSDRVKKWGMRLGSRRSLASDAGPLTSLERGGLDIAV